MPDITMRRVEVLDEMEYPGDFFWTYDRDDQGQVEKRLPVSLWYVNPHGRVGSVTITIDRKGDGEGWGWDRNLAKPDIEPSIYECGTGDEEGDWYGFIRAGVMSDA